ncbi:ABC transporter ATP-binding protein [Plantactinospora solaniradicis]|uniref:ABC transporter ATP-binding protein n=1 Tax=Plantactinospora solaniradicis TaxID=1723736 RepID=A0ABW1JZI6_9ACTN
MYAIEATGLGLRYGNRPALVDCDLQLPAGRVLGVVGPNGAGKSTLLGLMSGLLRPTVGSITIFGKPPGTTAEQLADVGFVAQNTPLYADLTVAEHLRLGAKLNPRWDQKLVDEYVGRLNTHLKHKAGQLSGGQRARLALLLAVAKRPKLLIFDEPVATLDPLVRREFLRSLMESVVELELTVVLSSHLVSDLERICDYITVLANGRVQLAGPVDDLVASHHRLIGTHDDFTSLPDGTEVILSEHTGRQNTVVVRSDKPLPYPTGQVSGIEFEDLVLAYMLRAADASVPGPTPPSR